MSDIEKITISLPGEMVTEIKQAVAAGEYTTRARQSARRSGIGGARVPSSR